MFFDRAAIGGNVQGDPFSLKLEKVVLKQVPVYFPFVPVLAMRVKSERKPKGRKNCLRKCSDYFISRFLRLESLLGGCFIRSF